MTAQGDPSGYFPPDQQGWPNTCSPQLQDGVAYGFLTGTSQSRYIGYQLYNAGDTSPFYISPNFQAGTDFGSPAGFVSGYAGATYFVAEGTEDGVTWTLNFSGVGGGTY